MTIYYIAQLTKPNGKFPFKIKLRSDEKRVLAAWTRPAECYEDGTGNEDDEEVFSRELSVEL